MRVGFAFVGTLVDSQVFAFDVLITGKTLIQGSDAVIVCRDNAYEDFIPVQEVR